MKGEIRPAVLPDPAVLLALGKPKHQEHFETGVQGEHETLAKKCLPLCRIYMRSIGCLGKDLMSDWAG